MKQEQQTAIIRYRLTRAKETLAEIDILIGHGFYITAANRLYYACYYAVLALFTKHNIIVKTHDGVRLMLGLHFVKTGILSKDAGKYFSELFDKRQIGDYDDFVEYEEAYIKELAKPSKKFVADIEELISKQS